MGHACYDSADESTQNYMNWLLNRAKKSVRSILWVNIYIQKYIVKKKWGAAKFESIWVMPHKPMVNGK